MSEINPDMLRKAGIEVDEDPENIKKKEQILEMLATGSYKRGYKTTDTSQDSRQRKLRLPKLKIDEYILEALVFGLNALVFIALGTTILRVSEIASFYIDRIQAVAPDYTGYVSFGVFTGYALLIFAILQMFLAAIKLYSASEIRRIRLLVEEVKSDEDEGVSS